MCGCWLSIYYASVAHGIASTYGVVDLLGVSQRNETVIDGHNNSNVGRVVVIVVVVVVVNKDKDRSSKSPSADRGWQAVVYFPSWGIWVLVQPQAVVAAAIKHR